MSWHYLRGQEAASWEENSLDGVPSALLNLIPTLAGSCSHGSVMEPCPDSRSGMTFEHLTASRGGATSTSLAAASHAKISPRAAKARASTEANLACGAKWPASFARYDPDTSSWKTHQCSLLGGFAKYSETWPRWGTMRGGECWEHTTPALHTSGIDSGSWLPTPTADDTGHRTKRYSQGGQALSLVVGGKLNPPWVEWLMGWPVGWTALEPLVTDRCRPWLRLHGKC